MKRKKWARFIVLLIALLQVCILCSCISGKEILSEINGDTNLGMKFSDYSGSLERTITIKNTQSGTFSVRLRPSSGNIQISITDRNGDGILSVNEGSDSTYNSAITKVAKGKGTYRVTIHLKEYSGSYYVLWDVHDRGKEQSHE